MMTSAYADIPDAPWIRMAETYGAPYIGESNPPEYHVIKCPVCGAEEPTWLFEVDGDVIGCTECVRKVDPEDWYSDRQRRGA